MTNFDFTRSDFLAGLLASAATFFGLRDDMAGSPTQLPTPTPTPTPGQSGAAVRPLVIGQNTSFLYDAHDMFRDLAYLFAFQDGSRRPIVQANVFTQGTDRQRPEDWGMGWDGVPHLIPAGRGLIANFQCYVGQDRLGTYDIVWNPSVAGSTISTAGSVGDGVTLRPINSNRTSVTFTKNARDMAFPPFILVTFSGTLPPEGVVVGKNLTFRRQGDTSTLLATDAAIADAQQLGSGPIRFMSAAGSNGEQRMFPFTSKTIWTGPPSSEIPIWAQVQICNEAERDLWLNIVDQCDQSYVDAVRDYILANLDPRLKVYVEVSNEVWNENFPQCSRVAARGVAVAIGAPVYDGASVKGVASDVPIRGANMGRTTVPYAPGSNVLINRIGYGYQVFRLTQGAQIGDDIAAVGTLVSDVNPTRLAKRQFHVDMTRAAVMSFKSRFPAGRVIGVLGCWYLDAPQAIVDLLLWHDAYTVIDMYAPADYLAGVTNAGADMLSYYASAPGLPAATRALYATNKEAFKAAWFLAAPLAIDAWATYLQAKKVAVEALLLAKAPNYAANAIWLGTYEGLSWGGLVGFPQPQAAYDLWVEIERDPRMKAVLTYALDKARTMIGGTHVMFTSVGRFQIRGQGRPYCWGAMEYQGQRSSPQAAALVEYRLRYGT